MTKEERQGAVDPSQSETGASAVLAALRARGIAVPDSVEQRIQSEEDPCDIGALARDGGRGHLDR
jgi:hypothetical protein